MTLEETPVGHLGGTESMQRKVRELLERHPTLFHEVDANAGCADFVFPIIFKERADGLHCKQRPLTEAVAKECDEQVSKLLMKNFIRPSESHFVSPVHMVHQKDKYRMCIDYTRLNSLLTTMQAPIPNIKDLLNGLRGQKFFATLDLSSGYHQFGVHPGHEHYTAFKTYNGKVYEFTRVPFGLNNAPAWFQETMLTILGNAVGVSCYVYIDDII